MLTIQILKILEKKKIKKEQNFLVKNSNSLGIPRKFVFFLEIPDNAILFANSPEIQTRVFGCNKSAQYFHHGSLDFAAPLQKDTISISIKNLKIVRIIKRVSL